MEAANSSAGDGDEHHREYGVALIFRTESVPHLRKVGLADIEHDQDSDCHEEQSEGEERIDTTDDLVDREHSSQDIVYEDDCNPEIDVHRGGGHTCQELSWTGHEDRADKNHQDDGEGAGYFLSAGAEIASDELREALATISQRECPGEEVVDGSGEDCAEDNPEVGCGAELCSHDGSEDGTETGDVEELNHEDFPRGKGDVVDSVSHCQGRCLACGVGTEKCVDVSAVDQIADYEDQQCNCKCDHTLK